MKIKLLVEYIGRETGYKTFPAGSTLRLDQQPAIELIAAGVAVECGEQPAQVAAVDVVAQSEAETEPPKAHKKDKVKYGKN